MSQGKLKAIVPTRFGLAFTNEVDLLEVNDLEPVLFDLQVPFDPNTPSTNPTSGTVQITPKGFVSIIEPFGGGERTHRLGWIDNITMESVNKAAVLNIRKV